MRWADIIDPSRTAPAPSGPITEADGEAVAKASETRRKAVTNANAAIRAAGEEDDPALASAKRAAAQARIRVANAKFQKSINK